MNRKNLINLQTSIEIGGVVLLGLALSITSSERVFALESSGQIDEVSVNELLARVLSDNAEIQTANAQRDQASARVGISRAKLLPKLSATASHQTQDNASGGQFVAGGGPGISFPNQNGLTTKFTAQLNLFNGGQDLQRLKQRNLELQKAETDRQATQYSQRERATSVICQILSIQSDIANVERKIEIEKEREADLNKRVQAQGARRSDLLSVQASIANSASDLVSSQSELFDEWTNLSAIAGKPIRIARINPPKINLEEARATIDPDRVPAVRATKFDLEASERAYRSTKGGFLPTVDLTYNRYLQRPDFQAGNDWDFLVTASIAIPIDGEKIANLRESRSAREQRDIAYRSKLNQERTDFEKLVSEYNLDLERYRILNRAVEIQSNLVGALKRDHQAGLVNISEYLNAVTGLVQKRQERDRLHYRQVKRHFQIRYRAESAGVSVW